MGSEFLGLVAASVLMQSLRYQSDEEKYLLTVTFFSVVALIFALNITYMVLIVRQNRAEANRLKQLEQKREEIFQSVAKKAKNDLYRR